MVWKLCFKKHFSHFLRAFSSILSYLSTYVISSTHTEASKLLCTTMWSALCVTLGEVLEVRGSNLTEDEAWVLLYAIGRQLKNVPDGISKNFVIAHDNVQLHRNGGLSIKFVSREQDAFPELQQHGAGIENALIYSLGMSLLVCLQTGLPKGKSLSITNDLQDVIGIMISPRCTTSKFKEIIEHERFRCGDWECHVTECFKELYKSIFGSVADMQLYQDCVHLMDDLPRQSHVENADKSVQVSEECCEPVAHSKVANESLQKEVDESYAGADEVNDTKRCVPLGSQTPALLIDKISSNKSTAYGHIPMVQCTPKMSSMLFCNEPPMQLNYLQKSSDFKKASHLTVEYVNHKKLRISVNVSELTCGQVLGVSVCHLIAPLDPTSFCISVLIDGEYVFMKPEASLKDITSAYFKDEEPHFFLRMKFIPDDLNSVLDDHLMTAIYMQTRRDILEGCLLCSFEEALLLAAYSLRYEFDELEELSSTFRLRDYLPPHILAEHDTTYMRVSLRCLHARLKTMSREYGRTMYLRKAVQLADFGAHSILIYLTKKYHPEFTGRILLGPRGIKILRIVGEKRSLMHVFSWDTLDKVSYKSIRISLTTKNKVKIKFYTRNEKRSKYVLKMLGEAHRFHRFYDFQSADQFTHPVPVVALGHETLPVAAQQSAAEPTKEKGLPENKGSNGRAEMDSVQHENESLFHPEISPFMPNVDDSLYNVTPVNETEHDLEFRDFHDATTDDSRLHNLDAVTVASVHANEAECDRYSPSDIPPPVHDHLTDISSCTSHEDRHAHLTSLTSVLDRLAPVTTTSKVQEEVYDCANKKIDPQPIYDLPPAEDIYAQPRMSKKKKSRNISKKESSAIAPETITSAHISGGALRAFLLNIETGSRGEGDGISNFSGPDQSDHFHARFYKPRY